RAGPKVADERGVRLAPAAEGAAARRRADRGRGHGRAADRGAAARARCRACRDRRALRSLRARRPALRARACGSRPAARVLPWPARRPPGGDRERPSRPRAGRVTASGGDPRRTASPEAERRARRSRVGARSRPGAHQRVIRWDAPGPYEVVFTTRLGGVSEGPYASLNLGRRTGDDVDRVDENRRRACSEIRGDAGRLALNYQVHSTLVHRAEAGQRGGVQGDGLWTDEPELPVLALAADCLPVALVRANGDVPAVCVVHAGRIGLLDGILGAAVE